MSLITVRNVPPYDGEYEFDPDRAFTTRELRWIKQIAGYLPMNLTDAFEGGDADLFVALAVIAMHRAGKIDRAEALEVAERFADVPLDDSSIVFQTDDEEVDADPPALTPEPGQSSQSSTSESPSSSGPSSPNGSATPEEIPSSTGVLRSVTSPTSDPTVLAS